MRRCRLGQFEPGEIVAALMQLTPAFAQDVLAALPDALRELAFSAAPEPVARQWQRNALYGHDAIGRLMEPVVGAFTPEWTVGETVAALRERVKSMLITYVWVLDGESRLLGVVTMRDLLFGAHRAHARAGDDARSVRAAGGDAAQGCDEAGARPPLSGLPGGRCGGAADRPGARPDDVRGAGDRDLAAGRQHDGRGEGGAPRHAVAAQPEAAPSVAAAEPPHRLPRRRGGRPVPGHARPAGDPRAVPAGARGAVRQHRLPGAGRDAARHDARRAQARKRAAPRHQGGMARLPERHRRGPRRRHRHVHHRGRPARPEAVHARLRRCSSR